MASIEKLLESKLRDGIKFRGGLALKFHCLSFAGFPDRLVLLPVGRVHFVELKDTGKKPTRIQLAVHKKITEMGFMVWVVDSMEKLKTFLNYVDRE